MRALCWRGRGDVRVEDVPEPRILNPRDAIVRVRRTAICGSDLHIYDGYVPTMRAGDVLGHEFVGEVVEVGDDVRNLSEGDRVVVPFPIACGRCAHCRKGETAFCDNSNPNAWMAEKLYGQSPAGIFGYSHMYGGYAGGQAEYVRVPFADFGPLKLEDGLDDEQVLLLSDVLPTGWQAAESCGIQEGDTIAVFGCGPVGLFAIQSAFALGAERVLAVDYVPGRLRVASEVLGAIPIDFEEVDVLPALERETGGRGPDACIDAVGLEAHAPGAHGLYDEVKHFARLQTDRPSALRTAIQACRKGGTVSIPGVYGGLVDKFPIGAAFSKGLTLRMGQTHVHRYLEPLLERVRSGELDSTFVISHRISLDEAPRAYDRLDHAKDEWCKVVLAP